MEKEERSPLFFLTVRLYHRPGRERKGEGGKREKKGGKGLAHRETLFEGGERGREKGKEARSESKLFERVGGSNHRGDGRGKKGGKDILGETLLHEKKRRGGLTD